MPVKHPKEPVFEFSKITDYIYIGTNKCCQSHFDKILLRKGVKADISLEEKRLDSPFGVDYYIWIPVKDHKAPSFPELLIGSKFIENLVKNRVKVYVHCENGHGRAPTLVAAYFILKGMELDEAIAMIKKKRPAIHPNKIQKAALLKFQRKMRR